METKISVVIPVYNAESTIIDCLKSITRQSYLPHEIIVVDNHSTDRSFEMIKNFIDESVFHQIRLVQEAKPGAASARNRGVALVQSELIAFTDADCQAPPDWIEKILCVFNEIPAPDIVVGCAVGLQKETALNKLTYILRHKASNISSRRTFDKDSFFRGPIFATLNVALKRSVFLKLSGFDESFKGAGGEDTDFYLRALQENMRIVFYPEIQVFHQERNDVLNIFKQNFNYMMASAKNFKKFFAGWFVLMPSKILFFRSYLGWASIYINKSIWLLPLALTVVIPIFFGKWLFYSLVFLYFVAGLFYLWFLSLRAGIRVSWRELPLMLFYYGLKQLGDVNGRIVGSLKHRVFYL